MNSGARAALDTLYARRAELECCRPEIEGAFNALADTFSSGAKLLVCGNGGSAADAEHIAGELLNKFRKHRTIPADLAAKLPSDLAAKLEGALPAISLVSMTGALSAIANDIDWKASFAQQTLGLAKKGDALLSISTSGNSANCVAAAQVAKALGAKTIALTGKAESALSRICDISIRVPESETFRVQELHMSIYHALCAALEEEMFPS